jgi:hypothetical protein
MLLLLQLRIRGVLLDLSGTQVFDKQEQKIEVATMAIEDNN